MNSISKLLVNRYWFRLLLSICLSVTATLFGVNGNFFWMGLSIGALVISIWWQLRLYRHHARQVLFMIDALENNDNAFHFPEDQDTIENRQINHALNRVGHMLYNVKAETTSKKNITNLYLIVSIPDCWFSVTVVPFIKKTMKLSIYSDSIYSHIYDNSAASIPALWSLSLLARPEISFKLLSPMNGKRSTCPSVYRI